MDKQAAQDQHILPTYRRRDDVFVSGQGALLRDAAGKEWLDMIGGIAVSALGHGHPRLVAALQSQVAGLLHVSNLYRHPHTSAVASLLAELTGMAAAFFSNSGSEANECALKIARKAQVMRGQPERSSFVALNGSFHGRTLGALSVTAPEAYRRPFGPLLEVEFVEPEDLTALESALAAKPAALILEPIQGEGGLRRLSASFLRSARELCDQSGSLLIHDEVQCGAGRSGLFLAGDAARVRPDIVTLAKPLGAGVPIGATLVSAPLAAILQPGDHGSTFGGGPLALCAAQVVLDEWKNRGMDRRVRRMGAYLHRRLDQIVAQSDVATERRGLGLMQGVVVPGRAGAVVDDLYDRGVLACTASGDVVRFLPPYVITHDQLEHATGILEQTLTQTVSTCTP